mmetsp:Transcript_26465/g.40082  ORF Transcript_26465/g.40082 Transcript_26465/m.40082 type:complete len:359 (-) Transcript_26465:246-1322(-)|eukprot:CAMPEP_0178913674 /NCGR_PEP_ID=MMETSP0786-20121207/10978_1 /TAXON_ID=186022 /ORGANISM="Thalassionema frauenfeldii, Strain CCMP 1798" /LENGTH=358 /DNA_ID=CAMNT_0020586451 /DNA_START=83 /DNA_END=1162 /DNA_ORIENTATION=+
MFASIGGLVTLFTGIIVYEASDAFQFARVRKQSFAQVSLLNSQQPNANGELVCAEGFIKKTGPNGDYCVFDYESAAKKFGTDSKNVMPASYWDGMERQNKARKKFGLSPLTPEQYVALQAENQAIEDKLLNNAIAQAFDQFDVNNDGVITLAELKIGLESTLREKLSEKSVAKVMDHFDTSGDGLLQQDEFVTLDKLRDHLDEVAKEEQQLAFDQFDLNNDGVITLAELKLGMEAILRKELSEESVQKVMDHFDRSGDGLLQPDEFVTLDKLRYQVDAVAKEEQQLLKDENGEKREGIFGSFLRNLAYQFEDRCESNFDCEQPEVCCDFGYKKMCCSSGQMVKNLQLEYATVPVPQSF